jgi:hypothetical protein
MAGDLEENVERVVTEIQGLVCEASKHLARIDKKKTLIL